MDVFNRDIEGIVAQREALERMMMSDPRTEKKVRGLVRRVLKEASKNMSAAARAAMKSDPRGASKAIRSAVYRRVLGGNLNILSGRGRSGAGGGAQTRGSSRAGKVGGNRRGRNARTALIDSYTGKDRSFVLRWINGGTQERAITFKSDARRENVNRGVRGGRVYGQTVNTGRRGSIAARNWFGSAGKSEMEKAADRLSVMIEELIAKG